MTYCIAFARAPAVRRDAKFHCTCGTRCPAVVIPKILRDREVKIRSHVPAHDSALITWFCIVSVRAPCPLYACKNSSFYLQPFRRVVPKFKTTPTAYDLVVQFLLASVCMQNLKSLSSRIPEIWGGTRIQNYVTWPRSDPAWPSFA